MKYLIFCDDLEQIKITIYIQLLKHVPFTHITLFNPDGPQNMIAARLLKWTQRNSYSKQTYLKRDLAEWARALIKISEKVLGPKAVHFVDHNKTTHNIDYQAWTSVCLQNHWYRQTVFCHVSKENKLEAALSKR